MLSKPNDTPLQTRISPYTTLFRSANNNSSTQSSTTYTILDDDTLTVELNQASGSALEANGGNLPQLLVAGQGTGRNSGPADVAVTGGSVSAADYTARTKLTVSGVS